MLVGALLPASKSAARGNYNLQYLSAAVRSDLTPFVAVQHASKQSMPAFGLQSGIACTLYVPGAGILWSDEMVWKQSLPERLWGPPDHYGDDEGKQWSVDESYRVFFQDKFNERYPWTVEQVLPPSPHQWRGKRTLQSGSAVRLYNPTAAQYLCVIPKERVVTEAGYFGEENSETQSLDRIRVG